MPAYVPTSTCGLVGWLKEWTKSSHQIGLVKLLKNKGYINDFFSNFVN